MEKLPQPPSHIVTIKNPPLPPGQTKSPPNSKNIVTSKNPLNIVNNGNSHPVHNPQYVIIKRKKKNSLLQNPTPSAFTTKSPPNSKNIVTSKNPLPPDFTTKSPPNSKNIVTSKTPLSTAFTTKSKSGLNLVTIGKLPYVPSTRFVTVRRRKNKKSLPLDASSFNALDIEDVSGVPISKEAFKAYIDSTNKYKPYGIKSNLNLKDSDLPYSKFFTTTGTTGLGKTKKRRKRRNTR
jgi:hypothetical protein